MKFRIITLFSGILTFICGLYFRFLLTKIPDDDLTVQLTKRYTTYADNGTLLMIIGGGLVIVAIFAIIMPKARDKDNDKTY